MNKEEAIKRIRDFGLYHAIEDLPYSTKTVEAFKMAIQALEEPERKKGKWIKMSDVDGIYWVCSECGEDIPGVSRFDSRFYLFPRLERIEKTNFCPNCGADMRKETKDAIH